MKTIIKQENQSISLINFKRNKPSRNACNKGQLLEQKPPLKLKEI
jgi:hypothetical protein